MNNFLNKLVRVTTIYDEQIIGIVIRKPILVLHLKCNNGILVIYLDDIKDIEILGDVLNE